MNTTFKFLKAYSADTMSVDRLIVTAFISINNFSFKSKSFLRRYIITNKEIKEYKALVDFMNIIREEKETFDIEYLIELFEFIVSPEDKVVTGAVYTPAHIRNYIIEQCLAQIESFENLKICDPACGCSGFLYTAAKAIKTRTNKTYFEIFRDNIYGLDIQDYSITRSKLLLILFALSEGEMLEKVEFNLFQGNALNFDWSDHIDQYSGFHVIVGNPPYVCSRNMNDETLQLLGNWSVTKSGHPDLYIPFFQIGYENLTENGVLGIITVNTFIKSINGRALRSYFAENKVSLKIINFGGEQIFKDKNTYTCLCFLRRMEGSILYKRIKSSSLLLLSPESFLEYSYSNLNHHDGWNLVDTSNKIEWVNKIESVGKPFKDLFNTRNGIATLKNDIYKFKPTNEDDENFYITKDDIEYAIEKNICRRIVNANKIKSEKDLVKKEEKIIFPYIQDDNELAILPESNFKRNYPNAYNYLKKHKKELDKRDKGKVNNYEAWYAYGRRQSMDTYAYKLFFPHICEKPTFVICKDAELLFYNGIAVISDSLHKLVELKSLLESDVFFEYIKNTTKDYSSGYISLSRNYLKNFGIPEIIGEDKRQLRQSGTNTNLFWSKIYKREFLNLAAVQESFIETPMRL